jgi:4-hydroxy-3-methylbut-2-enyl diphosphate reductase
MLVKSYGFCFGVERAVGVARKALDSHGRAYVIEDLIHNVSFMQDLVSQGVVKVSSIDEVPDGSAFIVSAHGASPEFVRKCESKGLVIIDATCPIVKSVQDSIAKNATSCNDAITVIVGDKNHAEIVAMIGHAAVCCREVFVVANEEEVKELPNIDRRRPVFYYTQTTFDRYRIEEIIDALKEKIPQIRFGSEAQRLDNGHPTCPKSNICEDALNRQDDARLFSETADLIIVVGSPHSSNTSRLAEIAKRSQRCEVLVVESENDLPTELINEGIVVIIMSGASTPNLLVEKVATRVASLLPSASDNNMNAVCPAKT